MALSLSADAERASLPLSRDGSVGLAAAHDSDSESYESYRVMSAAAVISCILAAISAVALIDFWLLKVVPLLGVIAGTVAWVRIARAPDEFSGRKAAIIGTCASAFFLTAGTGLAWWGYVTEVPAEHRRISYEQLKPTAERPNSPPPSATALDGQQVFIKGFMFPTAQTEGIRHFVLCRDNGDCCFGGTPPKSDMVLVHLQEPLHAEFTTRIRGVAGTFRVAGGRSTDGNHDVLYRLDADYIK